MNTIFVSSRLTRLIITGFYFSIGGLWALYADNLFVIFLPRSSTTSHSAGPCYWCFIVLSSGLLYLLLSYWNSSQTKSQQSLRKMNRSLKSYSECAKVLIRAENETVLMQEICRTCVEVGGHLMAWVAFAENDQEKTLKPVAHWGEEGCFFETFQATWGETECGRGPIGTSIRTCEPVIFQNLSTNPRYQLCREAAEKCGFSSCISLPLRDEKQIFGALVIFNGKPNAFDKEEASLLEKLAEDLSYGIRILRLKVEYKQEMEERLMLATVTDQASDGVITFDASGIIQYVNPSFIKLCGIPASEGVGISIHDFECSKRNPDFYQAMVEAFDTKTVRTGHFVNKSRDGKEHDIDARISPVFDTSGHAVRYVVTVIDVSQEVQLQRQLRRAQKKEALDTFSGGIVHDFNNILANIVSLLEVGLVENAADRPVQENLFQILRETLRGKQLIKQFMTISEQREQPRQPLKISEVIQNSMNLLDVTIPSIIKLKKDITPGLGVITGDETQIHQMMSSLCANASDAMQASGGILEVSLRNMDIPIERVCHYPDLIPGEYVKLTITDTGHGMDRDKLERIFDPFYTTKAQGGGRGLGLSIVHRIIKSHRGSISVNSIVGIGTTFVILLPLIGTLGGQEEKSGEE